MTSRALVVAVPHTNWETLPPIDTVADDAAAMANLLGERGFDVSLDASGMTCVKFTTALERLRDATLPGDQALLYFSGHGYRLRDANEVVDEPDGWDEAIVLRDAPLRDDWFGTHFWPSTEQIENTKWVTCVDACYSASALIYAFPPSYPIPDMPSPQVSMAPNIGRWRIDLAAASDREQALQMVESPLEWRGAHGWMTGSLVALANESPDTTYATLWPVLREQAASHYLNGRRVPLPQIRYVAVTDALINSPVFTAVSW